MSFWGELKRRNVYKVGVAYAIVAWLLIQAAAIIFPHLNLPSWATTFVIVILIIGFPIALLLAWAYEVTPEGIKRTKEVPLAESITHLTGQKLNYIVTGLLVVAVAFLAFKVYFADRRVTEPEMVSTETEQAPSISEVEDEPKTIAVLPFKDISPEKDQEYFVDGLSEELINCLTKISDLHVTSRTSSFTFKNSDKTIQEIAEILGRDYILEGSVRKVGNELRITAQLIRTSDDRHLWSETYDRKLEDILAIQEEIATAVVNELKATLGVGKSLRPLGRTDNVEAYGLYLVAQGQYGMASYLPFHDNEWSRALESIDAAIALDTEFALAWALKAIIHNFISTFGPVNRRTSERDEALRASLKAIELEPNLADGYLVLYANKISRCDFIEAGHTLRKALELKTEPTSGLKFIFEYNYLLIGNFERANELTEEMLQNDPLNQNLRLHYFVSFGLLGDMKRAEEEYERSRALFGDPWSLGDIHITHLRLGAGDSISHNEIVWSHPTSDIIKEHLNSPEEVLSELRQIYTNGDNLIGAEFYYIASWAAYFGDPEFAMDAIKKAVSIDANGLFHVWYPVYHEVRQLPRFKDLVREIGLVDYWNEFGWPDICHQLDNGDFECD